MSNSHEGLSVLLPDAGVAVFSKDKATLEAARGITHDWRFARVRVQAEEGDVVSAAKFFKDAVSPDLVIVQTDVIDDNFTAQLEDLAGSCDESTAAIVIGPVNDVYLYRKLIDMGVSDYLVRPVATEMLTGVIAKTLVERKGVTGSRLIGFVGAKGGAGVTTLAAAAAWGVADILRQKVALFDASGGWSTLSVNIGFEPASTLSAAARSAANQDEDSLKRMLHKAGELLSVLATGSDAMLGGAVTESQMESLIDALMMKFPVVIADLSRATPDLLRVFSHRANQIILISPPTAAALRMTRSLIHEMRELRGKDDKGIELIINMQGLSPGTEISRKDIEQAMELKVASVIPFLPKLFMAAENESRKIIDEKEGQQIVRSSLLPILLKAISGEASPEEAQAVSGGFLGSLLNKVKGKGKG